jgi:hypothetical protein
MELMWNKVRFKEAANSEDMVLATDEGNPDIPKRIEDVDKVDVGNVVMISEPKMFTNQLRQF